MIKGTFEVPLHSMIDELGENHTKSIISDFYCPQNKDVESFLKNRAIEFSKQKITQTQLVFAQYKDEPRLIAYYSLTNKSISIKDSALSASLKKRIAKFGTRDTVNKGYVIPAPLIAQLGKNFSDGLNKLLTGDELLKMALDKISTVQFILGGKVVYVECEDNPKLLEFYARNGFIIFGERPKDSEEDVEIVGDKLKQLLKVIK